MHGINALQAFASLIDQFPDMIHSLDRAGNIVYANRAASLLLGYSEQELLGMNIWKLYPPEIIEAVEKGFREVQQTGDKRVESLLLAKDGTRIPVEIRTLVLRDSSDAFAQTFSISRDLRKIRKMRRALSPPVVWPPSANWPRRSSTTSTTRSWPSTSRPHAQTARRKNDFRPTTCGGRPRNTANESRGAPPP
jgi:PAS domain S-box-containing protein